MKLRGFDLFLEYVSVKMSLPSCEAVNELQGEGRAVI